MSDQFDKDRIAVIEAQIVAYEDALTAFGDSKGVLSYTIDTGQSRQTVTRSDISSINKTLDSLYNRRATMLARCGQGGVVTVRPAR